MVYHEDLRLQASVGATEFYKDASTDISADGQLQQGALICVGFWIFTNLDERSSRQLQNQVLFFLYRFKRIAEKVLVPRKTCELNSAGHLSAELCDIHDFLRRNFAEEVSGQAYGVLLSWLLYLYKEWIGFAKVRELVLQAPSFVYYYVGRKNATKAAQLQHFRKWWKRCLALSKGHSSDCLHITFVNNAKIGRESHYIGLVYQRAAKILYYFDPSMGRATEKKLYSESRSHYYIDNLAVLQGLTLKKIFPPKRCQRSMSDTYCQTWVLLFHRCFLNEDLCTMMADRDDKERERQIVQAIKAFISKERASFDEYVRADTSVNNSVLLECKRIFSPSQQLLMAEPSMFFY